ncbi:winged helix-turn-helix domain-containing protein [Bradyrhizobium sp. sGM-13]|uniref:winged helix-turn-helix domain-containing tetratricopeptide repeat protein n=1 Tax=Bradyrhizobium sp. sGM-13 TaxID=2831781 RepID=UPI001BCE8F8A|nr:winged helix-turn-helix domain-containing protein [Bradyrhizobium sp. sGM-13]
MPSEPFTFGPFMLDMDRGMLSRDGRPVAVGQKGLLLLQAFLQSPGKILGKASLMDVAWPGVAVEESNLSVQIAALRKLLGTAHDGAEWITTVPRVGYRFAGPVASRAQSATPQRAESNAQSRPIIAVLPFGIIGEVDKEYLADGLTEDIITALSRFRWFRVIGRGSAFIFKGKQIDVLQAARELGARYVLQGSVRQSALRLRITAQVIDASDGSNVWAERYDLEMADVFAIQDEIAERVAGAIEPELLKSESYVAAMLHTGNMTAWDLVRRGMWHFHKVTRDGHLAARALFRHACTIDPDLPESHIWLGRVSAGIIAYGWSDAPGADSKEGVDAAAHAIALDPRDPYAHYAFAIASAYSNAPLVAVSAAEKAIALSSSFALGHLVLGLARLFAGLAREAIEPLEHGLALNPNDPQNLTWYNLLAYAQLLAGEAERALATANRVLAIRPTFRPTLETLTCCHVALGKVDDARRCASRMNELTGPESHFLAPLKQLHPEWDEQISQMLDRARA